jgi:hypothetical protein
MPSMTHEGLVELLRDRPELLEVLLKVVGVKVPLHDAVAAVTESLGAARPIELRVDGTFRFTKDGSPVLAAIVEVQLAVDEHKRLTWPAYATNGTVQFGCETIVVVLTNSRKVASWAKQVISFSLGLGAFVPIVLGPDEIPQVQSVADAMNSPWLAALSAVVHGHDADAKHAAAMAEMALTGAMQAALKPEIYKQYYYVINAALSEAARKVFDMFSEKFAKRIDDLMAADFMARGETRGRQAGLADGKAQSILAFLEARGLTTTDAQRDTILRTVDHALLDRWLRLAATVESADALFVP